MINKLAQTAFNTAITRGKTSKDLSHDDTFFGILEELREFRVASEFGKSKHLPEYTEARKSWPISSSAASPSSTVGE